MLSLFLVSKTGSTSKNQPASRGMILDPGEASGCAKGLAICLAPQFSSSGFMWVYVSLCKFMWVYVGLCKFMWVYVGLCGFHGELKFQI